MCVARLDDGEFDPERCPLLAGLPAHERARRLSQPWVKACIAQRRTVSAEQSPRPHIGQDDPALTCRLGDPLIATG